MRFRFTAFALLFALLAISISARAQKPADTTKIATIKSDSTTTKVDQKTDSTVYITKSGKKYHRAGCIYLGKSAIAIKLSDAKKYYQPCKRCKPVE